MLTAYWLPTLMYKISPHCVNVQHLVVVLLHNYYDHDLITMMMVVLVMTMMMLMKVIFTCMYWTALIRVWKVFPQGDVYRYLHKDDDDDDDDD